MMQDMIKENGKFCFGAVGVYEGDRVIHVAPPAKLVAGQIKELNSWCQKSDLQTLIKSAYFIMSLSLFTPLQMDTGEWADYGIQCYWENGKRYFTGFQLKI